MQFDRLSAGKKYVARVAACNRDHCGEAVEDNVFTKPPPPQVEKNVYVTEPNGSTVIMVMPILLNPPGCVYI